MAEAQWLQSLIHGGAMIALFIVVFLVARWVKHVSTAYDVRAQLIDHDNPAIGIIMAGYYLGVTLVFLGAYLGPSQGLFSDLIVVGSYSLLGILLLNLSRFINDHLVLRHFSVRTALLESHNIGVAFVLFASYVAAGLVVAGAVHGEGGNVLTALVFYLIGQAALLLFTLIYDRITPYSLQQELASQNIAAGLGYGGALIAIGLIVMNAVSGSFVGWLQNLQWLGVQLAVILLYLPLVRWFFDKIVLRGVDLNREISRDRNVGAGALEMAMAVSFSLVLIAVV